MISDALIAEIDIEDLPGILRELVELMGLPATLKLVDHYGGVRLYVPVKYDSEHVLVRQIGAPAATILIEHYGGEEHFDIPKAERALRAVRDRRIRAEYAFKSRRRLAREYDLTERQIGNIVAGVEWDDGQESLF